MTEAGMTGSKESTGSGSQQDLLTDLDKRQINRFLWRWLPLVGSASAVLGGLVTWAFVEHQNAETARLTKGFIETISSLEIEMNKQAGAARTSFETAKALINDRLESARKADEATAEALNAASKANENAQSVLAKVTDGGVRALASAIVATSDVKELIVEAAAGGAVPVGSILAWPVTLKPPANWRICDGDTLDIKLDDCEPLAKLLGATYGAVGPGKVKLPNFQGYFLRGAGGNGNHTSASVGVAQPDMTTIVKAVMPEDKSRIYHSQSGDAYPVVQQDRGINPENRPVNYAVHWIIRVK